MEEEKKYFLCLTEDDWKKLYNQLPKEVAESLSWSEDYSNAFDLAGIKIVPLKILD